MSDIFYGNFIPTEANPEALEVLQKVLISGKTYLVRTTWEKDLQLYIHGLLGLLNWDSPYRYLSMEYTLNNAQRIDFATDLRLLNQMKTIPSCVKQGKGRGVSIKADIVSLKRKHFCEKDVKDELFGKSPKRNEGYVRHYLDSNPMKKKVKVLYYHLVSPQYNAELNDFISIYNNNYATVDGCEVFLVQKTLNHFLLEINDQLNPIHTDYFYNYNHHLLKEMPKHFIIKEVAIASSLP